MEQSPAPFRPEELLCSDDLQRAGRYGWLMASGPRPHLHRVRRGAYVPADRWAEFAGMTRHRALVLATFRAMRPPLPVASHYAAAALWGLPILGRWPSTVDVLREATSGGGSRLVRAHRVLDPPPTVQIAGVLVTTAARTVVDLARTGDLAAGLIIADAALHARLCSQAELDAQVARLRTGARGCRHAALAIRLADGRAESPGESLSRARIFELGLPQPDLQVPLADAAGVFGYADFGWEGLIGEFDGRVKYLTGDDLWREKKREDRVRRTAQAVARWVWADAFAGHGLARILRDAGLVPMPGVVWRRWDPVAQPIRAAAPAE
ncbi:hypothetical protein HJ588_01915 [Flexivirga sp. ID2601S]|uniref:AbiEi antitoxin C-terminal domain-containing protein n=1 Tax=Flexivirga aerilata TaxID=1656889 RepID=A0A849AE23_9MICO|nr:hypothetical protein [Flexivirga aerilata]NNG38033.1 hypothetical protein [Flexivirga aerilata]